MPPTSEGEHLKLATYILSKPREAVVCVLANERLSCLDKSLEVFATKA